MKVIYPPRLKAGEEIRVVAPSSSLSIISRPNVRLALRRLTGLGYKISFGKHVLEKDMFNSSSIKSRVADLHQAFKDKEVKAVLSVIGGYNANQLLPYLDFKLIRDNPKIFCGYSDITILANAIFARTGLVTYLGPSFSSFAMIKGFEYSESSWLRCLSDKNPYQIEPSPKWSDDKWYKDQNKRKFYSNAGPRVINLGRATGRLIGGNLCTFNLLQGTPYCPNLKGTVLLMEDDDLVSGSNFAKEFDRDLTSLIQQPGFSGVRGILIGRFQCRADMTAAKIRKIITSKKELKGMPVIADMDFGHTTPQVTLPIGGQVEIVAGRSRVSVRVLRH